MCDQERKKDRERERERGEREGDLQQARLPNSFYHSTSGCDWARHSDSP